MPSFKGKSANSVDDKGRIAIPAKMRKVVRPECQDTFVMTRGFEKCIALYPIDVWERLEANLNASTSRYSKKARRFKRLLMEFAGEVTFDGQGRIMLSQDLMTFADIGKVAWVCGVGETIEIWNEDLYAQAKDIDDDDYEDLAQDVFAEALGAPTQTDSSQNGNL